MKKFGLEITKHMKTLVETDEKLSKYENDVSVDPTLYRSMIENLLYLTVSRLDISFRFKVCARYQANPKESHIVVVKRIIKYVNETINYGYLAF